MISSHSSRGRLDKAIFGDRIFPGLRHGFFYAIIAAIVFSIVIVGWRGATREAQASQAQVLEEIAEEMTGAVADIETAQKLITRSSSSKSVDATLLANLQGRVDALSVKLETAAHKGESLIKPVLSRQSGTIEFIVEKGAPGRLTTHQFEQVLDCAATLRNGRAQLQDSIEIVEARRGRISSSAPDRATYR